MQVPNKKPIERICHALAFEIIATLLCAPVLSWVMDTSLTHTGMLTITFSAVAMAWNMVFNALFERVERRHGLSRTLAVRAVHAFLFEGGLVVLLVPLAAAWLGVSLWQALVLDFGLMLFFLPYTFCFNLGYDHLRSRWVGRRVVA
jgi:uncharacterized membrane protein